MRSGPRAGTLVAVVAGGAIALALAVAGDYTLYVVALVVVQAIAIMSLNLLMGYAGQVSLGQAALVGIGAYAAAELSRAGVPFPAAVVASAAFGALVGAIVGLPSLRIRGLQVAATTLAFGVFAEHLLFVRPWDSAAGTGLAAPRPTAIAGGRAFLLVATAGLLVVVAADRAIRRSRIGRALVAVRDREDTAPSRGIRVGGTKVLAYALSGAYAGIAGALFASLLERVSPETFTVWVSLGYVAAVVVGGLGFWVGAIVAGVTFAGLPELLRPVAGYAPLAGAVLLATVPVLWPRGLGWVLERRVPFGLRARTGLPPRVPDPEAELAPPQRALALAVPVRTLLRTEGVAVSFGGLAALRDVSIEVERGEIVGLIGPNGAGKTTFFNCLSGFVRPDAGSIRFRDRDLLSASASARPALGIARTFQQVGLSGSEPVWDNLLIAQHSLAGYGIAAAFARSPSMRAAEARIARRAAAALDLVGLREHAGDPVGRLPHGKQRLAEVAAAIAMGPELLLLDEPFAGMGPEESAALAERLVELRDRMRLTILVIEHDVPLVASICDHVYVLDQGAVIAEGAPAHVQADPAVVSVYIGEAVRRQEAAAGV